MKHRIEEQPIEDGPHGRFKVQWKIPFLPIWIDSGAYGGDYFDTLEEARAFIARGCRYETKTTFHQP